MGAGEHADSSGLVAWNREVRPPQRKCFFSRTNRSGMSGRRSVSYMEEEQSSEGGAPLLSMQISPHHRRRGRGSAGGPVQRGPGSSSRGSAPSAHWNRPTTPPRHWHEAQVDLNCSAVRTWGPNVPNGPNSGSTTSNFAGEKRLNANKKKGIHLKRSELKSDLETIFIKVKVKLNLSLQTS